MREGRSREGGRGDEEGTTGGRGRDDGTTEGQGRDEGVMTGDDGGTRVPFMLPPVRGAPPLGALIQETEGSSTFTLMVKRVHSASSRLGRFVSATLNRSGRVPITDHHAAAFYGLSGYRGGRRGGTGAHSTHTPH